jgi:hypothetical protein
MDIRPLEFELLEQRYLISSVGEAGESPVVEEGRPAPRAGGNHVRVVADYVGLDSQGVVRVEFRDDGVSVGVVADLLEQPVLPEVSITVVLQPWVVTGTGVRRS